MVFIHRQVGGLGGVQGPGRRVRGCTDEVATLSAKGKELGAECGTECGTGKGAQRAQRRRGDGACPAKVRHGRSLCEPACPSGQQLRPDTSRGAWGGGAWAEVSVGRGATRGLMANRRESPELAGGRPPGLRCLSGAWARRPGRPKASADAPCARPAPRSSSPPCTSASWASSSPRTSCIWPRRTP